MPIEATQKIADCEEFDYPPVEGPPLPSWEAFGAAVINDCGHGNGGQAFLRPTASQAMEAAARAEEVRGSFAAGRQRGWAEGQAAEREAAADLPRTEEARRIEQAARLAEGFNAQRAQYFESVEREVVKLALAVSARILRRESQMDPLLLSGAVRVALGQLSASTEVRLRVPASDFDLWRDTIAHLPNLAVKPAVMGDDAMMPGGCELETEHGSVDLGIQSQLAEIERGFFAGTEARTGSQAGETAPVTVGEEMSE